MKIKRFVDTDMRQVLQRVREDQGPEAVILSNRRIPEGIEVIAAVDYDEALVRHALGTERREESAASSHPHSEAVVDEPVEDNPVEHNSVEDPVEDEGAVIGSNPRVSDDLHVIASELQREPQQSPADSRSEDRMNLETLESLQFEVSNMRGVLETQLSRLIWQEVEEKSPARIQVRRNLTRIGLSPDVINIITNRLGPLSEPKDIWRAPLLELAQLLPVSNDTLLENGGIAALVGATGVGKTTTIAKLAFRYAIRHGADSIALVCADSHRIGAQAHLESFAKLLGIPVYPADSPDAVAATLDRLGDKSLVLIDTEGGSQRDRDLAARLAAWGSNQERIHFYLTLAATCQEAGIDETISAFDCLPLAGAIVTKIDEAAQLGCVVGSLIRHDLQAAYFSDGQRVPDDLYPAARKRLWLINQIVDSASTTDVQISEEMLMERFAAAEVAHA